MSDASSSLATIWKPGGIPSLYSLAHYLNQDERAVALVHKCNLCGAEYNDESDYKTHLTTHFDHRCPYCDYVSKTEGRLKRHVKDLHDPPGTAADSTMAEPTSESDDSSQPNQNRSRSGRDRPRVCKCKHCGFTSGTREEFWEHAKSHIRDGKGLECPQCPFVTEYKHHLEYHLRNHFGSKPFKCHKCNYSCVNKSMLNSHLKSHSNVYQYRCEDCHYATKYCHSLKLHLRKYNHRPATVLNPDGTPNPYPIIDVYGTRRGPRPKKAAAQPPPRTLSPIRQRTELPADSVSQDLSARGPAWLSSPPLSSFPLFHWTIPAEVQRALIEQAARNTEQQSQTESETDVLSAGHGVEELAIKEEADDWSVDAPLDLSRSSPLSPASTCGTPATQAADASSTAIEEGRAVSSRTYGCRFCDLDFRDCSMYKIHMEYHGTDNPFKCRVCGEQTADRLDFYVHLTRNPHA